MIRCWAIEIGFAMHESFQFSVMTSEIRSQHYHKVCGSFLLRSL